MRVDELHTAGASNGEYIFIIANGERQSKQKFLLLWRHLIAAKLICKKMNFCLLYLKFYGIIFHI
jgi:hypothetical protein